MVPPKGLKRSGQEAWKRIFSISHITDVEYFAVFEYCKNIDIINEYENSVKKKGTLIEINNGATTVVNPLIKEINELKKMNFDLMKELGLTTKMRYQLELMKAEETDFIADLFIKIKSFRGGISND